MDHLLLRDAYLLLMHWEKTPPVHVSVAGFIGWGKGGAGTRAGDDTTAESFVAAFKARIGGAMTPGA